MIKQFMRKQKESLRKSPSPSPLTLSGWTPQGALEETNAARRVLPTGNTALIVCLLLMPTVVGPAARV